MLRLPAALEASGLGARMLLQVHDELLFEVPEDNVEALLALGREIMEAACDPILSLRVPLVAEGGYGDNWVEAH